MLNFKTLTEAEAVQHYRLAKDPKEQIKILSQILCGSEGEVKDMLRAHGCAVPGDEAPQKIKRGYDKWSEEDIAIAKARFNEGVSCEDIAKELGRDKKGVNMKLNSLGCSFSKRNAKKREGRRLSNKPKKHESPVVANNRAKGSAAPQKAPLCPQKSATDDSDRDDECRVLTVKEAAAELERLTQLNEQWIRAAEKLECETPKELKERIAEMLSCVGRLTLENKREKERTELILGKFEKVIRLAREKCDG